MACQPVRIQVEKDFTQHPGETDAQSVTQSDRVELALLFPEDSAGGAPSGTHSEETSECRDACKKPMFFGTQKAYQLITFAPINSMSSVTSKAGLCHC